MTGFVADTHPRRAFAVDSVESLEAGLIGVIPIKSAYWSVGLRAGLAPRRVATNPVLREVWERCLFLIRGEGRFAAWLGADGQLRPGVLDDPAAMQDLFGFCRAQFPTQLREVERLLAAKHGASTPLPAVGVHQMLDGHWFPRWALDAENLYIHPDAE